MNLLMLVTIGFILLELTNVLALYFKPGTKYANGVGVFRAWEKSKQDPEIHDLVRYLVYWVAGTKLIFILLLVVILVVGDARTQLLAAVALALSISSFFWKLFPLIRKMDRESMIEPKGYSKVLGVMILAFVLVFVVAIGVQISSL
jgi:hypothetical protein